MHAVADNNSIICIGDNTVVKALKPRFEVVLTKRARSCRIPVRLVIFSNTNLQKGPFIFIFLFHQYASA